MAVSSCIGPADCSNRTFLDAVRGVRAAPAPALRRPGPTKQQDGQVPIAPVPALSRQARGRSNGQQHRRRSTTAAGSPSTRKLVMENIVILKRGEPIPTTMLAKSGTHEEKGVPVAAAKQSSAQARAAEPVVSEQQQGSVQAGIVAEPSTPPDQHGPETEVKKAEAVEQHATKANVADQCVPQPNDGKNVPMAAKPSGGLRTKSGAMYSSPAFDGAPEPGELPIPLLLLKGLGARLRP
jgi:hypothetical protein